MFCSITPTNLGQLSKQGTDLKTAGLDIFKTPPTPTKLALGKHLEFATIGFKMCILNVKKDKLGPNPSEPLLGHP